MSGCNSRQPHQYLRRAPACATESPKLSLPGAAPGRRANFKVRRLKSEARTSLMLRSFGFRASEFFRISDFGFRIFTLGSWQTSNALALQASLCGSVTHRLHRPSLEEQGCRTVAK